MISLLTHLSSLLLCVAMATTLYQKGGNDCRPGSNTCDLPCINNSTACSCPRGYVAQSGVCKDVDECDKELADCDYLCNNHAGNFSCSCGMDSQLAQDGRSCSMDPDLCLQISTQGTCGPGFKPNPQKTCCQDVNECNTTATTCNATTEFCLNTVGSYECRCLRGFVGSTSNCHDIDECTDAIHSHNCNITSQVCVNTPGSFRCDCLPGLMRNQAGICEGQ